MQKRKTDMEIFQGLVDEYCIHKKKYDELQAIKKDQISVPQAMKNAAIKCCNYIYNKHKSDKESNNVVNRILHLKEYIFFKIYADKIQVDKKGFSIKFLNAVELINQILKDHPGFYPTPKTYPLKEQYELYGDVFTVDGALCLITGSGKSKAMRKVTNSEETVLDFAHFTVEDDGLYFNGQPISYFVHMVEQDEISPEEITAVSAKEFLLYAFGNYGVYDYEGPEEILPVLELSEEHQIPMLLVPWGATHEEKIKALTNYFTANNRTLRK